jgi:hypothetical protein
LTRKVIYILGAGRSGTTLLDIILGNGAGVRSCGELVHFTLRRGVPHGREPGSATYEFWKGVGERFFAGQDDAVGFELLERLATRVDYHRAFCPNYFGLIPRRTIEQYSAYIGGLYDSIFAACDESVIVDSSKYPSRALALYKYLDYDIRFVYLVRHPVMVARSFQKRELEQPPKGYWTTNQYYFLINMACRLAVGRMCDARVSKLRYETLLAEPERALRSMQQALDVDLSRSIQRIEHDAELEVGHLFEGNRIRLQESLRLRRGGGLPGEWTVRDRIATALNGVWWRGV